MHLFATKCPLNATIFQLPYLSLFVPYLLLFDHGLLLGGLELGP